MKNEAILFVKPHALASGFVSFVEERLDRAGVEVKCRQRIGASEIREGQMIDRHYARIAKAAVVFQPFALPLGSEAKLAFYNAFDESWDGAIENGELMNASDAMAALGVASPQEFLERWQSCPEQVKLGSGLYACRFGRIIALNGFYPAMREAYLHDGSEILVMQIEWDPSVICWKTLRSDVLGETNPAKAKPGSMRRHLLESWRSQGLSAAPTTNENGVHLSAGPLDGVREIQVWMQMKPAETGLGSALLKAGLPPERLQFYLDNAPVALQGEQLPVLTATEGWDSDRVLEFLSPSVG